MFGQILFTHLRWTRVVVASMTLFSFLVPAVAWWLGGTRVLYPTRPGAVIAGFETVTPMLILISLLGAFLLAVYPWTMDAASKHVFPLSLPVPWTRYVAMRFGAGALLLIPSAIALWLGSLLALSLIELPPTLRAYPGSLALRFLAATLLTYSVVFAVQYVAGKRSAVIVIAVLATILAGGVALQLTGNSALADMMTRWLTEFPGPLAVYAADWKLIDV